MLLITEQPYTLSIFVVEFKIMGPFGSWVRCCHQARKGMNSIQLGHFDRDSPKTVQ
jgi:hypothetical protein